MSTTVIKTYENGFKISFKTGFVNIYETNYKTV